MLLAFWNNPEFIRHRRADLRGARALATAALAGVVCWLTGMSVWSSTAPKHANFLSIFYDTLWIMQGGVLVLWAFLACAQSVVKERDQKTYDFQRTTRLSSAELTIGKLFGAPIVGYFIFLCFLPVSIVLGLLARVTFAEMVQTFLIVAVFALLLGLAALVLSMKAEKSSAAISLLGVLGLYFTLVMASEGGHSSGNPLPGLAAFSPFTALHAIQAESPKDTSVPFFGVHVPIVALTLLLQVALSAWCVLMLVRNLKADFEEIVLLNRWQLLGFVAFLNFLFYGFLNTEAYSSAYSTSGAPADIVSMAIGLNICAVAVVGLLSVTPTLYFRGWYWRNRDGKEGYVSENGPPWPWLLMAGLLGFMFLTVAAFAFSPTFPLRQWHLGEAAGWMVIAMVFILRDVLFLQLLSVGHMKRAVVKGVLLLGLYYVSIFIIATVLTAGPEDKLYLGILALFTPFAAMSDKFAVWSGAGISGIVLQIAMTGLIVHLTNQRLARKAVSPPILAANQV